MVLVRNGVLHRRVHLPGSSAALVLVFRFTKRRFDPSMKAVSSVCIIVNLTTNE